MSMIKALLDILYGAGWVFFLFALTMNQVNRYFLNLYLKLDRQEDEIMNRLIETLKRLERRGEEA